MWQSEPTRSKFALKYIAICMGQGHEERLNMKDYVVIFPKSTHSSLYVGLWKKIVYM